MSAFLCSSVHLSRLVNAVELLPHAERVRHERFTEANERLGVLGVRPAEAMFNELYEVNVASVDHRYPDATRNRPGTIGDVTTYIQGERPASVVEALKLIQCYEYQACEHEGWQTSDARLYCEALTYALITALPGYDAAPWGV